MVAASWQKPRSRRPHQTADCRRQLIALRAVLALRGGWRLIASARSDAPLRNQSGGSSVSHWCQNRLL